MEYGETAKKKATLYAVKFKGLMAIGPATNANQGLWRFNRQIEKPRKPSKINHRPCPQKTAVTSKAARRRPPHDHRPRPVEVAFFRLFLLFFYDFAEKIAWRRKCRKCREEAQTPSRFL